MANRADRVITCSHYMREPRRRHLRPRGGPRCAVIPNGIDPLDLQPVDDLDALRARFAAPDERLIAAGRPARLREGLPARARRAAGPDRAARATCASSSPARARTSRSCARQATRLGLDEHGTFLGWIGDDVLHSLYRIADLCVVPSLYEPFGLVALEAMASGCPCIVADTGGLREVVPERRARRAALPRRRRRAPRRDGRAPADRRRSCATAWWPRPPSTCCASTGPTSPARRPRSTTSCWVRRCDARSSGA